MEATNRDHGGAAKAWLGLYETCIATPRLVWCAKDRCDRVVRAYSGWGIAKAVTLGLRIEMKRLHVASKLGGTNRTEGLAKGQNAA